jgi:iron complex transport system substrate-binding protein
VDFVLAVGPAAKPAIDTLRKLGVNIVEFPLAVSFAEIRSQIQLLAGLLNQKERGQELISKMDGYLETVSPVNALSPVALVLGPNGFTSGSGSLVADVLEHAGYRNAATLFNVRGFGRLSLEQLALIEPDVIILDSSTNRTSSLSREFLDHPVLVKKQQNATTISIESALWVCGGPFTALAVKKLVDHKQ